MSTNRTARRFAIPVVAAAGIITVAAGAGIVSANGATDLPDRTAAQLLADVHNSDIEGLSGTVLQNADLGLPDLGGSAGKLGAAASGSNQMRLWYAAPDKVRTAVLDDLGESDVIRNGEDVWTWDSESAEATHYTMPAEAGDLPLWPPSGLSGSPLEAAEQLLAAIEPSTEVSTDGTVEIADRDAYQLVLKPKDDASLVEQVRLAIDAETGVPLSTEVYAVTAEEPVFDVAFSRVEFDVPDKENFTFTPPAGVTVTEGTEDISGLWEHSQDAEKDVDTELVGSGWTTVFTTEFDAEKMVGELGEPGSDAEKFDSDFEPAKLLEALPEVSGDWGSGRLFTSAVANVLITDDGRLLAGAVTPERLYEVAAQ